MTNLKRRRRDREVGAACDLTDVCARRVRGEAPAVVASRACTMGAKRAYLVAFNFGLAAGWAAVLAPIVQAVLAVCAPDECAGLLPFGAAAGSVCICGDLYASVELPLKVFQTAAVLEVLHALFGVVRAPIFTTFIQVLSRQLLLWAIVVPFPATHEMPRFATMLLAWSVTEVVRYSFYGFALVLGSAPYPLVWLRYTLFFVLYPLGVGSELALIYACLPDLAALGYRTVFIWIFIAYVPGFAVLYTHMIAQRGKVIGGKGRPKRKESGISFPPGAKGDRSTTAAGKEAFAAAVATVDPAAAEKVRKEKNWRYGYVKHVVDQTELCCKSADVCVKVADAGLKHLYESFELIRGDTVIKLSEAPSKIKESFDIGVRKGEQSLPKEFKCMVPYKKGYALTEACVSTVQDNELLETLDAWAQTGVIEPSTRDAIASVVKNQQEWCNLSDVHVAMLGATSAMGPITTLLRLGATVYAVDIDRPAVWKRLFEMTKDSPGTLIYPLKGKPKSDSDEDLANVAGCNLMEQPVEITNWLVSAAEAHAGGKRLTIGMYGYLDAALHVKLSIGADMVMSGVSERYQGDVALAYLCTPTDAFAIPKDAVDASLERYKQRGCGAKLAQMFGQLKPNHKPTAVADAGGSDFAVIDGIVKAQGPNYILSKRMQAWRAMKARAAGQLVSINVAPSTATASVVSNKSFAAAFEGMGSFEPMEILREETSRAVMGALLIYDLFNPSSHANPATKLPHGGNPIHLFRHCSFHGGLWRGAYKFDTIGTVSVVSVLLKWHLPKVAAIAIEESYVGLLAMGWLAIVGGASSGMEMFMQ